MPAGRTHDQITLVSLPITVVLALLISRSPLLTLISSGGFLFSGLMFGPDLDIRSCQYRRWGWLRWIWLPYQKTLRHRSVWSHGFLIGTLLRVLYLAGWLLLFSYLFYLGLKLGGYQPQAWQQSLTAVQRWVFSHPQEGLALWAGLELGSMSHSWSDGVGSAWKRWRSPRRSWQRLRHQQRHQQPRRIANRTFKAVQAARLDAAQPSKPRVPAVTLWRVLTEPDRDPSMQFYRGLQFLPATLSKRNFQRPPLSGSHLEPNPSPTKQTGTQFPIQDLRRSP
jgi:uncharacterized metal-binding protein